MEIQKKDKKIPQSREDKLALALELLLRLNDQEIEEVFNHVEKGKRE